MPSGVPRRAGQVSARRQTGRLPSVGTAARADAGRRSAHETSEQVI